MRSSTATTASPLTSSRNAQHHAQVAEVRQRQAASAAPVRCGFCFIIMGQQWAESEFHAILGLLLIAQGIN